MRRSLVLKQCNIYEFFSHHWLYKDPLLTTTTVRLNLSKDTRSTSQIILQQRWAGKRFESFQMCALFIQTNRGKQ